MRVRFVIVAIVAFVAMNSIAEAQSAGEATPSKVNVNGSSEAGKSAGSGRATSAAPKGSNGNTPPSVFRTAPVVVHGKREVPERLQTNKEARKALDQTPGGVAMVTQEEISHTRAANLSDALDFIPGVWIGPRMGAADESQISIRGSGLQSNYHLRGVNLLLDGFPYGNADGFGDFETFELLSTKRVDVYKGANALRFGANSLGGAINLVTKTGYDAPLLETRNEGGSYGFMKNYFGSGQVFNRWDLYVGASNTVLGGYRDHSSQSRQRVYTSLGYAAENGMTYRLDMNYVHNDEKLPGELTLSELKQTPTKADPEFLATRSGRRYDYARTAFTVTKPLNEQQRVEMFLQLNYLDLDHPLPFAGLQGGTYSWNTELRYVSEKPLFGHNNQLTAGFQYSGSIQHDLHYQTANGNYRSLLRNQNDRATNIGIYLENWFNLYPRLTVITGGRLMFSRRSITGFSDPSDGDATGAVDFLDSSPKVGLLYQLTRTSQLFANVSRAYQPPVLLELSSPVNLNGSIGDLRAIRAWQFEVGTRGTWNERTHWDLSVYDYEIWDEIQNINVQPFPGAPFTIPRFGNIGRSRHTGIEVGGDHTVLTDLARRVGLGGLPDTITGRVAYTWSHFRYVDNPVYGNNQLPGIPENYLETEAIYRHASGFWMGPNVRVVPTHYAVNSANTVFALPYTLTGVRMGFDLKPGKQVFFEARNLTDKTYAAAVATDVGTGRYFDPGDGRSFYGGVSWSF